MAGNKRALITGASSGIGREFARQLGAKGYGLVLVARDQGRLEALAGELRERYGVEVEVLAADLGDRGQRLRVEERLAGEPPVGLLVNNAGFGGGGPFATLDPDREEAEVQVNCIAPQRLARAVLPGMLERKRGAIVNVSSVAGFQPSPFGATYAASKAFLTSWSEALHEEVRASGVIVQTLCPGYTRTEFQQRAGVSSDRIPQRAWMEADDVVEASLRALQAKRALCIPGFKYQALVTVSRAAPKSVVRRMARRASRGMGRHEDGHSP